MPIDLDSFLSIDISTIDSEHTLNRRRAVRNRFLAGLLGALEQHPGIDTLWLHVAAPSSIHWVMAERDPKEHDASLKASVGSEAKEKRLFFKSLGSVRVALSSTSRETISAMALAFPVWNHPTSLTRRAVIHTCEYLLEHPMETLTNDLQALLVNEALDQTLPQAPLSAPKLRL